MRMRRVSGADVGVAARVVAGLAVAGLGAELAAPDASARRRGGAGVLHGRRRRRVGASWRRWRRVGVCRTRRSGGRRDVALVGEPPIGRDGVLRRAERDRPGAHELAQLVLDPVLDPRALRGGVWLGPEILDAGRAPTELK